MQENTKVTASDVWVPKGFGTISLIDLLQLEISVIIVDNNAQVFHDLRTSVIKNGF